MAFPKRNKKSKDTYMTWNKQTCDKLRLRPAELFMLMVTLISFSINFVVVFIRDIDFDVQGYLTLALIAAAMMACGYFYRIKERSERIASSMICTGIFVAFTACISFFNYLMLPLSNGPYDSYLTQIDALLGYHWPSVMAWAADHVMLSNILKYAYTTTMPQMAILIVVLGLTGRAYDMHMLMTSVTITATLSVCFWGVFPTLGAKSLYDLPPEIWAAVQPMVDLEYTNYLKDVAINGPGFITPSEVRGLIAFPSFHAVLAFTAMYAARNVKYLAPIFLVLNLLILPATFIHGGHHLVDLPAGFAMFALGTFLAKVLVDQGYKSNKLPKMILQT